MVFSHLYCTPDPAGGSSVNNSQLSHFTGLIYAFFSQHDLKARDRSAYRVARILSLPSITDLH